MLEVDGIENIPSKGPAILVPNHSGIYGWDGLVLLNEIFIQKKRIARMMVHSFWSSIPVLKEIGSRYGFFKPDFKSASKILKRNNMIIIFPEAEKGNFKPTIKMYQLQDFNPGFVALSILSKAPIIPISIIGAEENYINLGTIDWFEEKYGIRIPVPLNLLPLKSKWKIKILRPITLSKYNKKDMRNEKFLHEVAQNIRFRIQASIHKELVRKGIFRI